LGIEDELRAAQERAQRESQDADDAHARREATRAAYHAEEAALTAELLAAARRTFELLVDRGERQEIQVWARPRLGPNHGLVHGWRIPDPVHGTSFRAAKRALVVTGEVVMVQPGSKRSDASKPMNLETWIANEVKRARFEIKPDQSYEDALTNHYEMAFGGRYYNQHYVARMQQQLASMRGRVMNTLAEMLSEAGVTI